MKKAFLYSLKHSIPVMVSFFPLGIAWGLLMQTSGFNWIWTGATSIFVFAGSLQFLMVSMFTGGISLLTVAAMALLLNSRHIFYGIPFIEQFRKYGAWKFLLILLLPDETFSLHCSNDFDDGNERHRMFSFIFEAVLVYSYWVVFTVLGALIGSLIPFDSSGIDFAMTALFIVILLDQLKSSRFGALPAVAAVCSSAACLLIFGPSGFILPSLLLTVGVLFLLRGRIEAKAEPEEVQP